MDSVYGEKFFRNVGTVTKQEQLKIKNANFTVIGLGGTGGFAFENLLRMGAENFVLFDRDRFELSNFNRQLLANDYCVDVPKVEIAAAHAKAINKDAKIANYYKMFDDSDDEAIKNCDVVIDCSDNVETHLTISNVCKKLKKPMVFCTASFAIGMVTVISGVDFSRMFQLPKNKTLLKKYNTCTSVLSTATAVSGSLAAQQAVNLVLKKNVVKAPSVQFFDLFAKEPFYIKKLK